jgi:hypothetical protein
VKDNVTHILEELNQRQEKAGFAVSSTAIDAEAADGNLKEALEILERIRARRNEVESLFSELKILVDRERSDAEASDNALVAVRTMQMQIQSILDAHHADA